MLVRVEIERTEFRGNTAAANVLPAYDFAPLNESGGGAVQLMDVRNASVKGCTFVNNTRQGRQALVSLCWVGCLPATPFLSTQHGYLRMLRLVYRTGLLAVSGDAACCAVRTLLHLDLLTCLACTCLRAALSWQDKSAPSPSKTLCSGTTQPLR